MAYKGKTVPAAGSTVLATAATTTTPATTTTTTSTTSAVATTVGGVSSSTGTTPRKKNNQGNRQLEKGNDQEVGEVEHASSSIIQQQRSDGDIGADDQMVQRKLKARNGTTNTNAPKVSSMNTKGSGRSNRRNVSESESDASVTSEVNVNGNGKNNNFSLATNGEGSLIATAAAQMSGSGNLSDPMAVVIAKENAKLSGGNIARLPAVFSKDAKYLFTAAGSAVNVYSAASGERVRCLRPKNSLLNRLSSENLEKDVGEESEAKESDINGDANFHEKGYSRAEMQGPIVALWINKSNSMQVVAVYSKGNVCTWDVNDGTLLHQGKVSLPASQCILLSALPHPTLPSHIIFLVSKSVVKKIDQDDGKLATSPALTGAKRESKVYTSIFVQNISDKEYPSKKLFKGRHLRLLAVSHDGKYIAAAGEHILLVYTMGTDLPVKFNHPRGITCINFHPSEAIVAFGDNRGEVLLLHYKTDPSSPVTSSLHWHANALSSLSFSSDGAYLLSAGKESVLVIWQVRTGHRQFLPRLGSPISAVSSSLDDTIYAVSHVDNSIRLISAATLKITQLIQGLKMGETSSPPPTGIVVEPRNNNIVLNSSSPGTIQFFDPRTDRHIRDIEIVPRHHVTSTPVIHVAFGGKGKEWMATVERREEFLSLSTVRSVGASGVSASGVASHTSTSGSSTTNPVPGMSAAIISQNGMMLSIKTSKGKKVTLPVLAAPDATFESRLRFWHFSPSSQKYVLSTCAESPHGVAAVTAVQFHPTEDLAVTCGMDKKFRIWALATSSAATTPSMQLEFAGVTSWFCRSVGFYRDYYCSDLTFSEDGSVMAIAYGPIITLWDVESNTLQTTLSYPPPNESICKIRFITGSPFLVAVSTSFVYVWNLLTCSVWWATEIAASSLIAHPFTDQFMIFAKQEGSLDQQLAYLFRPVSHLPLEIHQIQSRRKITCSAFVPSRRMKKVCNVVYLGEDNELKMLDAEDVEQDAYDKQALIPLSVQDLDKLATTTFAQVFGKSTSYPNATVQSSTVSAPTSVSGSISHAIFNGPAHVIPSVTQLYEPFVNMLLSKFASKMSTNNSAFAGNVLNSNMDVDESVSEKELHSLNSNKHNKSKHSDSGFSADSYSSASITRFSNSTHHSTISRDLTDVKIASMAPENEFDFLQTLFSANLKLNQIPSLNPAMDQKSTSTSLKANSALSKKISNTKEKK